METNIQTKKLHLRRDSDEISALLALPETLEALPDWYQKSQSAQTGSSSQRTSPSIPPQDLFRDATLYSSWDDNGIPLTDAENQPFTKSAQKKLRKAQAAHKVRHLKYLRDASRKDDEQREQSPGPRAY